MKKCQLAEHMLCMEYAIECNETKVIEKVLLQLSDQRIIKKEIELRIHLQ